MSKLQEKIELYTNEAEKLGLGLNAELLAAVTKGLGPSIYKEDAEKVSSSDKKELETVKKNFLIKKLGLEDGENLDKAIETAIEKIGKSNRNKYRALFYTILVEELGKQSVYDAKPVEEKVAEAPKEEVKEEAVAPKVAEKAKKEVDAPTAKTEVKKEAKKEEAKEEAKEDVKVEEEAKEDAPAAEAVNPEEFLENFDWHKYEEGIEAVDEENIKAFEAALEGTLGLVNEREVIEGLVVRKTDREVIIDINSKSEGVISLNEFRYNPDLKVGDTVEVLVDKREDSTGQLVLSHKKARVIKAWERVNNAHETGEVVNGFVKCRTRGGMIVDVLELKHSYQVLKLM